MAIRAANIFAGISAAGSSGAELVWFGQVGGYTAPLDATTALDSTTANEVQTITISGTPTGGTFTLSLGGATTTGIAYNAIASVVQAALVALSTVGSGNVVVTGGPGPGTPYIVTFGGTLGNQNVSPITASAALLTGGTTPSIAVVETTPGKSGLLSAGLITEDGIAEDIKENSKETRAYGVAVVVRRVVTSSDITVKTAMLEVNRVSMAVRSRLPLNGIAVTSGAFAVTEGAFRVARYGMVVHAVDGLSAVRKHYPSVEVTDRDGQQIKNGEVVASGVTLTAYPDATGTAVYTYYNIDGLT